MNGYLKLKNQSRKYVYYVYLDHIDNQADGLFYREHITVKFWKDYIKPGWDWKYVLVKVRKEDENQFVEALSKLPDKLLISGIEGYDEALQQTRSFLDSKYT